MKQVLKFTQYIHRMSLHFTTVFDLCVQNLILKTIFIPNDKKQKKNKTINDVFPYQV